MSLTSPFINLMHPCGIKVLISFRKKKSCCPQTFECQFKYFMLSHHSSHKICLQWNRMYVRETTRGMGKHVAEEDEDVSKESLEMHIGFCPHYWKPQCVSYISCGQTATQTTTPGWCWESMLKLLTLTKKCPMDVLLWRRPRLIKQLLCFSHNIGHQPDFIF